MRSRPKHAFRFVRLYLAFALTALPMLTVAPQPAAAQQQRSLSPAEARSFALGLLQQGRPRAAREVAIGLLRKDSRDYMALMVLANAELKLGRTKRAKFAARRAWRSTSNRKERFAAAFSMSNILKAEERYGQAQFWLRRAVQTADEPRFEQAAKSAYRKIRNINPWTLSLGFTLAPTSNVNGGPNDNTYTIGDLVFVDPTAVPLSGLELGTKLDITRRFKPQSWGQLSFSLGYDETRYILSQSAKVAVPTASGSDYAFTTLDLTLGYAQRNDAGALTTVDFKLGRHWKAREPLADFRSLRLSHGRSGKMFGRYGFGLTLEDSKRLDSPARSTQTYSVDVFALKKRTNGDFLRYGASLAKIDSASADMAHGAATFSLGYYRAKPVFGAKANFTASLGLREYDRLRYGTTIRRDQKLSLIANFTFEQVDYYGFSPTLTLRGTRNFSNKTLFDNQEYSVSIGVKSTF